jgi:hypothetical protein
MDGDGACSQHEATTFCTEEMDRVLFQRGVPIGAGVTTVGHGRGAAATGHAAATTEPGRGVAATMGVGLGATTTRHATATVEIGRGGLRHRPRSQHHRPRSI